jgi:adenylate cyclase class 2
MGFVKVHPRHFESNTLYDFPDQRLRSARCLLRVRHARRVWFLTFKGPPAASQQYKSRMEFETRVEDGERLGDILEGLGLERTFRYDKYRAVFAPGTVERGARGALLVLDETPIGNYLELEGPEAWIDRTAARFGYTRDNYITASYGALYRAYCESKRLAPGDMVFKRRGV